MSLIHYKNYHGITLLARDLRKNQTPSEKIFWEILRKRNLLGYKFLRQHPIFYRIDKGWVEFYIADFYCNKLKLVFELDGEIHTGRKEYDSERDAKLLSKGIVVIRILNKELDNMDLLLEKIKNNNRPKKESIK
jgi:very-short-patch-repair endonuclease